MNKVSFINSGLVKKTDSFAIILIFIKFHAQISQA